MIDRAELGFCAPDYLTEYASHEWDREALVAAREERLARVLSPRVSPYKEAAMATAGLASAMSGFDFSGDVVTIGAKEDLHEAQQVQLMTSLRAFCPWKKGPFSLFGVDIDAEWRSDWKWQRVCPEVSSLKGKRVADIGCHNGYFMFRMAEQDPACVIGFEPFARHYWNFQLIQQWVQQEMLHFELLGVEQVDLFPKFFDTIFCLGILYHHTDPVGLLRKLRLALAPKGEIIIDCQGIPGELPVALTPKRRYAQAKGIWFLPTQSCLTHWLERAGFADIRCFFAEPLSTDEQRRTEWADIESLREFLDPDDPTKTIEGYPAPWRYYIAAKKG